MTEDPEFDDREVTRAAIEEVEELLEPDAIAQAVIKNMDKQIAPMVWYALKRGKHKEVKEMMTRRQQLIDQLNVRKAEDEKKTKSKKGVIRRRKSVHR